MASRTAPDIGLPLVHSGKVRDVYDAGSGRLLLVASDRLSAFDVVMAEPVPDKGRVLTAMTRFWIDEFADVHTHLLSTDVADLPAPARAHAGELAGRSMLVRRVAILPIECIVRGYLAGSGWKEYQAHGTVHGTVVPRGLVEADRLPEPLFTPSTKAPSGSHDENITFEQAAAIVGPDRAEEARALALDLYRRGAARAEAAGILVADTKFELGIDAEGRLVVADEVLTPDSSRFWPADGWQPGRTPASFDKQPVRDWLEASGWAKQPPPPPLPADVVRATRSRYIEAYERISRRRFADWPG